MDETPKFGNGSVEQGDNTSQNRTQQDSGYGVNTTSTPLPTQVTKPDGIKPEPIQKIVDLNNDGTVTYIGKDGKTHRVKGDDLEV